MHIKSNQWEQKATVSDSSQVSSGTLQSQVTFFYFIIILLKLNLLLFYRIWASMYSVVLNEQYKIRQNKRPVEQTCFFKKTAASESVSEIAK